MAVKADDTIQISAPKVGAENWRRLLDCVSYRSGTRFPGTRFWRLFYFVPISGIHVTTTATGDWLMPLFSFCLYSLVMYILFIVNFCVDFFCTSADFRRRFLKCVSSA